MMKKRKTSVLISSKSRKMKTTADNFIDPPITKSNTENQQELIEC